MSVASRSPSPKPSISSVQSVSKIRSQGIAKDLSRLLGKGQLSGRVGLILFEMNIVMKMYLFIGSAIFVAIERNAEPRNSSHPANSNTTETLRTPLTFNDALIYVITVVTTIGYGHVVATGIAPRVVMIAFSLGTVPLFNAFLSDATERIRNQLALLYERFSATVFGRKGEQSALSWRAKHPDVVLFALIFIFFAFYMIVTAAVFYACQQFGDYLDAFYFLFQTVALIGFGDILPANTDYVILFVAPIVFGTILFQLCAVVIEEWMQRAIEMIVDAATCRPRAKPMEERTLKDLMRMARDRDASSARLADVEKMKLVEQLSSAGTPSLYEQPFSIGRVSLRRDVDDDAK